MTNKKTSKLWLHTTYNLIVNKIKMFSCIGKLNQETQPLQYARDEQ